MIPDRLLRDITLVRPSTSTDRYGTTVYNYGLSATRSTIRGWIEQRATSEPIADGRDPLVGQWMLITNASDVRGRDRVEWSSRTFDVEGAPAPIHTPAGFHHTEAELKEVNG